MSVIENPIKILLVDDDHDDCELTMIASKSVKQSTSIKCLHEPERLMEVLGELVPDIVFLDINMPMVTGFECLKKIREDRQFSKLPVIMLTTSSARSDIDHAYEFGADRYIIKPFELRDLAATFSAFFNEDWQKNLVRQSREDFLFER